MLRITNFPAAAAEEVSSKEKPSPRFPPAPFGKQVLLLAACFFAFCQFAYQQAID